MAKNSPKQIAVASIEVKATPVRRPPAVQATNQGRVHLYIGISLDGFIAAPDGGTDWLKPYRDAMAGFEPFMKTISASILGRTTYDHAVKKYRSGGAIFAGMPAYVVTHQPLKTKSSSVIPFTGDLRELVKRVRKDHCGDGGDIWLIGGGSLTRSFIEADLLDLLSIAFVPVLLGAGLPMFPPGAFTERRLKLVRQNTYPSGVVELRYERC